MIECMCVLRLAGCPSVCVCMSVCVRDREGEKYCVSKNLKEKKHFFIIGDLIFASNGQQKKFFEMPIFFSSSFF